MAKQRIEASKTSTRQQFYSTSRMHRFISPTFSMTSMTSAGRMKNCSPKLPTNISQSRSGSRDLAETYMNGKLRKEINYKKKLRRTFENSRTTKNWNNFRIQRNKVTSLKRAAITGYFLERCSGGPQSKDYWPTIKPFLSKGSANSLNICLLEDGNVVNDPVSVCNIFNNHFQTTLAETLARRKCKITQVLSR